jgi:hypothetical protein
MKERIKGIQFVITKLKVPTTQGPAPGARLLDERRLDSDTSIPEQMTHTRVQGFKVCVVRELRRDCS